MTKQILIAGFGGQGILFSGKFLAYEGLIEDKEVNGSLNAMCPSTPLPPKNKSIPPYEAILSSNSVVYFPIAQLTPDCIASEMSERSSLSQYILNKGTFQFITNILLIVTPLKGVLL